MVMLAEAPSREHAPAVGTAWSALARVPDPEIPVVTVVELGIVRAIEVEGSRVRVRVTPTYSGCPATEAIAADIEDSLRSAGFDAVHVDIALSPPWTTDWIAPEAKRKLGEFGIAPPGVALARVDVSGISPLQRKATIACPRCGSTDTRLVAQFSSTACKALYRCEACREPFDYMKPL